MRTDAPLKAWLFRVAQHRCLDALRRARRNCLARVSALQGSTEDDEPSLWVIIPDPDPLPEEVAERHEVQRRLRQAIATLPSKYRAIVLLRSAAQLTVAEIGQALHSAQQLLSNLPNEPCFHHAAAWRLVGSLKILHIAKTKSFRDDLWISRARCF